MLLRSHLASPIFEDAVDINTVHTPLDHARRFARNAGYLFQIVTNGLSDGQVVNSLVRASAELTYESAMIIGVKATSQPQRRTTSRNGSLE